MINMWLNTSPSCKLDGLWCLTPFSTIFQLLVYCGGVVSQKKYNSGFDINMQSTD